MAQSGNFSTDNKYIVYWIECILNSQNISGNTSNVTVKVWAKRTNSGYTTYGTGTCYCTIDGAGYSQGITTSQKITSTPIVLLERTVTINHNTDGSKTLSISASISHSQFSSGTNSWSMGLTTIPRGSKFGSVPNFTLDGNEGAGAAFAVPVTKYSSSFTDNLIMKLGGTQVASRWDYQGGTVTFDYNELMTIYGLMGSNSASFSFTVNTFQNGTFIGSDTRTATGYLSATGLAPTLSAAALSYADTNADTLAITGDSQMLLQGYSNAMVSLTEKAAPHKGATLGSNAYRITVGNTTQYASQSDTLPIQRTFNKVTAGQVTGTAIDNRGNGVTVGKALTIVPYVIPLLTISVVRWNPELTGENLKLTLQGAFTQWSGLAQDNALQSATYRLRSYPSGEFGVAKNIPSVTVTGDQFAAETTLTDTVSAGDRFEIEVTVTDKLASKTQTQIVESILPAIDIDAEARRVGIGRLADDALPEGSLHVAGSIRGQIYRIGDLHLSVNPENPSTYYGGTWQLWGAGRVPVCVDTAQTEFSTVEKTGGEKKHTQTVDELAKHSHDVKDSWYSTRICRGDGGSAGDPAYPVNVLPLQSQSGSSFRALDVGGGQPFNILQPYIACYIWKRVA